MPEFKQIERIIRILQKLATGCELTVNDLYRYFEGRISKRTLQRDLIELSAADIPLMTRQGTGKELIWYLDSNYLKFIPETLGNGELLASFYIKQLSLITKGTPIEQDINSLLNKTKQLLPHNIFHISDLGISDNIFGMSFTGYIDYTPHYAKIENIIKSIIESKVCQFRYKSTWKDADSVFEAEPYQILYHKGALYAVVKSLKNDKYLFLPIQRIKLIVILDRHFMRDPKYNLDLLKKGRFGIFGSENLKPQKVVLKFKKEIAEVVAERIWHQSQKIKRHHDGSLTLEMKVVISDELRSWVGSWLEYVEVIKPEKLLM